MADARDPFAFNERWLRRTARRVFGPRLPAGDPEHFCDACRRDFLIVVERAETADERWRVRLRCGACGAERVAELDGLAMQRLDRALMHACEQIEAAAERAARARMAAWADAFTVALDRDLVGADDFTRC